MRAAIRNIGNSKGIIIPKNILAQCDIEDSVTIEVKNSHIIITATPETKRKGWESAFQEMAKNGDDTLLIPDVFNEENTSDWTWK